MCSDRTMSRVVVSDMSLNYMVMSESNQLEKYFDR
jgi:hypothetical protein